VFVAGMQCAGANIAMDILEKSYATGIYHKHDSRAFDDDHFMGKTYQAHIIKGFFSIFINSSKSLEIDSHVSVSCGELQLKFKNLREA
jgi:hypothetical protein